MRERVYTRRSPTPLPVQIYDYRRCVVCHRPLLVERVLAIPETVTCVDHSQVFRKVVDVDGPDGVDLVAHLQSGGVEN